MIADPNKSKVLVVDDEVQIRRLLRFTLEEAGYTTREAATGLAGLHELTDHHPDVIILDLGLPDLPGVEVLRRLREWTDIPVLILSVFGQEGSKIAALDAGADDYLTKPFAGGELLARLRAVLRRVKSVEETTVIHFGSVEVDLVHRRVMKHKQVVKLTLKEYALLRLFITHRGKVLTHQQILHELWGPKAESHIHYLRVYMMRLRRKLEDEPDTPKYLQTESGIGYRFLTDHAD